MLTVTDPTLLVPLIPVTDTGALPVIVGVPTKPKAVTPVTVDVGAADIKAIVTIAEGTEGWLKPSELAA